MRKFFWLTGFCLLAGFVMGQNPGNVGIGNLTAWFRADNLTIGNVNTWTTTFPTGGAAISVSDFVTPFPVATATPAGATSNYNTTIDFAGNTTGTLKVLENTSALNLLDNTFSTSQGTFFSVYYLPSTTTQSGGHVINYREGSSGTVDGIQFRTKLGANTGRLAIGSGGNSANASNDYVQDFLPDIISYKGNRGGSYQSFRRSRNFVGGVASSTTGSQGIFLGARFSGSYNGLFDGFISEMIFYNRDLTNAEMARVHTYLGLKFGITLDNTGGGTQGDYIAPSGTVLWDASQNSAYHNDVIGLGREDSEGLLQKQSHAFDDNYRIYLNSLQTTNQANTGVFNADASYIMMGHQNGRTCGSAGAGQEIPLNPFLFSRLEREWKVTKTNFSQPVNIDLLLDTCAIQGGVDPNALRLLVDDDGNFTNAAVFAPGGGLSFAYNAGVVTINGLSDTQIPNNSTRFFTLAYAIPEVSLSGTTTICEGDSTQITFNLNGTPGPYSIDLFDGTNTQTLNVSNGTQIFVSPTTTTTWSVSIDAPFNCCGNQYSSQVTITVNPRPNVTANVSNAVICEGDSAQLTGAGALTYLWDSSVNDSDFVSPSNTTLYTVIGTDANGCLDTADVTLTVNPAPNVAGNLSQTPICVGDSAQLTGSGAVSYVWDNGVVDGDFVSPANTTTYTVIGSSGAGCNDIANVILTVNPLPLVTANASVSQVCEGEAVLLSGGGASSYVWTNGVQDNQPFVPADSATYTVVGTDANGCVDSASVFVGFVPAVEINLGADTVICPGLPILLQLDSLFTGYAWQDSSLLTTFEVTVPGTYSLTVTDSAGCTYFDEILIERSDLCDSILIPNVFTPNGDGQFDNYVVEGPFVEEYAIQIFDRWGRRMFETEDINEHWNGNSPSGGACPTGTYYFVLRYRFFGEEEVFEEAGYITIMR